MKRPRKADARRGENAAQETFFNSDDAIWLTNAAARELKEKQATAAAPTIRDKAWTVSEKPNEALQASAHRTNVEDYGPTRIVQGRSSSQRDATPSAKDKTGALGARLFRSGRAQNSPPPRRAVVSKKPKRDRSDFIVGAMGLALGLTCALFPWYIFFNQEKFGVREFVFSGEGGKGTSSQLAYQPARIGQPFGEGEVPRMDLDFFPTATLPAAGEGGRAVPVSEQPFPADLVTYELVHVANGRAMIMDDTGLWVVQPGSQLPDASRVASIEKRDGRWVLVTTQDRVVKLER